MTYSELGYLQLLYEAKQHECAGKSERDSLDCLFAATCARLKLAPDTAEIICEALEGKR